MKDEAEYTGIAVNLDHPERAVIVLWLVWTWGLIRYLQKLYEAWSCVKDDVLEDVYAEDRRLALTALLAEAKQRVFEDESTNGRQNVVVSKYFSFSSTQAERSAAASNLPPPVEPDFHGTRGGGRQYRSITCAYEWHPDGEPPEHGGTCQFIVSPHPWSLWRTRRHRLKAWAHATIRLPGVSDHFFPLLLACAATTAIVATVWWPGLLGGDAVRTQPPCECFDCWI